MGSGRKAKAAGNLQLRFLRSNGERNAAIAIHSFLAFRDTGVFGKLSGLEESADSVSQLVDEGKAAIQSSMSQSLQEVIPKIDSIVNFVDMAAKVIILLSIILSQPTTVRRILTSTLRGNS